jgi:hypothetical protein
MPTYHVRPLCTVDPIVQSVNGFPVGFLQLAVLACVNTYERQYRLEQSRLE